MRHRGKKSENCEIWKKKNLTHLTLLNLWVKYESWRRKKCVHNLWVHQSGSPIFFSERQKRNRKTLNKIFEKSMET